QGLDTLILAATSPGATRLSGELSVGFFQVTSTADSGAGSLRQAIDDANAAAEPGIITFSIPHAGIQTIVLATPLPPISSSVLLDGFSQPGYSGTPLVVLSGFGGLSITGGNVVVRGLTTGASTFNGVTPGVLTFQSGPFRSLGRLNHGVGDDFYRIDVSA